MAQNPKSANQSCADEDGRGDEGDGCDDQNGLAARVDAGGTHEEPRGCLIFLGVNTHFITGYMLPSNGY